MALVRVNAADVVPGDRMGEGRWQGVVVVATDRWPTVEGDVHLSLGAHGWLVYRRDARVLVERQAETKPSCVCTPSQCLGSDNACALCAAQNVYTDCPAAPCTWNQPQHCPVHGLPKGADSLG